MYTVHMESNKSKSGLVRTHHGRRMKWTEDEIYGIPNVPECAQRRYRQQAKCLYKFKRIEIISSVFFQQRYETRINYMKRNRDFSGGTGKWEWLRICLPMQGTQVPPRSGKTAHATGQLSPCAHLRKPRFTREVTSTRSLRTANSRAGPAHCNQRKSTRSNKDPQQLYKERNGETQTRGCQPTCC